MIIRGNFIHNFLEIPEENVERIEESGVRMYSTPSGTFPSVTTVTGWEKRMFFAQWRKNNKQESTRVCNRGNTVHSLAEKYLLNEEINLSEIEVNERNLFNLLKPEIDKIDEVYGLEKMLWGERTGLAGRVDCIARYNGKPCVIDFKGSTKPKYKEDIENYFMQATAYTLLLQERTGMKISDIVILIANEQGYLQVFEEKNYKYLKPLADTIKRYYMDNFDDTV
jgi:genome maintenance exonuclease 1